MDNSDSESDLDDLVEKPWSVIRKRNAEQSDADKRADRIDKPHGTEEESGEHKRSKLTEQQVKFEELRCKSNRIMCGSALRRQRTELRRSQKLLRRALRDPCIRAETEGNTQDEEDEKKNVSSGWEEVRPFLSINSHLQGPIPHGDCGPKTELECQVEDCIKEGDFEKAELLSDTLANREFGAKIARAFAAKEYSKSMEKQRKEEEFRRSKKIRWMFEAKEKWQMKGNM